MSEPILLLGGGADLRKKLGGAQISVVITSEDAREAFARHRRGALWIAPSSSALTKLRSIHGGEGGDQRLLVLSAVGVSRLPWLRALFRIVVAHDGAQMLPRSALVDVLRSKRRDDLLIGGVVDRDDGAIVLYRGSLESLVVPISWFKSGGAGVAPDLDDFEVTDSGQTVRLGAYEAAVDAILYEHDPRYRRRAKKRLAEKDRTFGGSLRRLRLQRGLRRADFSTVSEKEIARIERGEVERPHGGTLEAIAKRLGVTPRDIETY